MLVGYNTNISYKGVVYHVQTEDSGVKNPHIITLLYNRGTILSRKKTSYAEMAEAPDYKERVRELMKEQHKAMIKELIAGRHTSAAAVPAVEAEDAPPAEAPPSVPPEQEFEGAAPPEAPEPEAAAAPVEAEPPAAVMPQDVKPEAAAEADNGKDKRQISRSLDDILLDYLMKEEDR